MNHVEIKTRFASSRFLNLTEPETASQSRAAVIKCLQLPCRTHAGAPGHAKGHAEPTTWTWNLEHLALVLLCNLWASAACAFPSRSLLCCATAGAVGCGPGRGAPAGKEQAQRMARTVRELLSQSLCCATASAVGCGPGHGDLAGKEHTQRVEESSRNTLPLPVASKLFTDTGLVTHMYITHTLRRECGK